MEEHGGTWSSMDHYGLGWSTMEQLWRNHGAAWEMRRWGRRRNWRDEVFSLSLSSMGLLFRDCGRDIPRLPVLSISGLREEGKRPG